MDFLDRVFECFAATEFVDELVWGAELVEWGDLEEFGVVENGYAFVFVFVQDGFEDFGICDTGSQPARWSAGVMNLEQMSRSLSCFGVMTRGFGSTDF